MWIKQESDTNLLVTFGSYIIYVTYKEYSLYYKKFKLKQKQISRQVSYQIDLKFYILIDECDWIRLNSACNM